MPITRPIKWYKSLLSAKGRRREGFFLVEGRRQVEQLLESYAAFVEEVITTDGGLYSNLATEAHRTVTAPQMSALTERETTPEVVAVMHSSALLVDELPDDPGERVLFLENVQDPGNVGTLLRSAVAFGFSGVILTAQCADPLAPKVVRSTGGALGGLWCYRGEDAYAMVDHLCADGAVLVTADLGGGGAMPLREKVVFALGNEGNGVSDRLRAESDYIFTIPFEYSKIESLNVAVAGSIGMSSLYKGE